MTLTVPVGTASLHNEAIFDAQGCVLDRLLDPYCFVSRYRLQELVVVLEAYLLMPAELCLGAKVVKSPVALRKKMISRVLESKSQPRKETHSGHERLGYGGANTVDVGENARGFDIVSVLELVQLGKLACLDYLEYFISDLFAYSWQRDSFLK